MQTKDLAQRMKSLVYFKDFSVNDLISIIEIGKIQQIEKDTTLFYEDDESAGIFVVLNGEIHLYKNGLYGKETIMAILKPVTMLNEVSVLDGGPNPATAIAAEKVSSGRLGANHFKT